MGLLSLVVLLTLIDLCCLEASSQIEDSENTSLENQYLVVFLKGYMLQKYHQNIIFNLVMDYAFLAHRSIDANVIALPFL